MSKIWISFRYLSGIVCESRKQFTSNLRGASSQPTELCRDPALPSFYRWTYIRLPKYHPDKNSLSLDKIPQHNHPSLHKCPERCYIGQTQLVQGHIPNIQAKFRPPGPTNLDDNDLQSTTFSEVAWRVCGVICFRTNPSHGATS